MEQLLQNPLFVGKLKRLSPSSRRWFIEALIDLFDQESEYVIDVIEDCRDDMRDLADSYKDEAEQLRAASRLLHEKRESPSSSPKRSMSRVSAPSRLLYVNERQGTQDSIRLRHRRRRIATSDDGYRCVSSMSVASLSTPSLPVLVDNHHRTNGHMEPHRHQDTNNSRVTRSLPVTPLPSSTTPPSSGKATSTSSENTKRMQEETKAILQSMNDKESHLERERERQQERLERIRHQKRALAEDRTTQALKLLEKALEMDERMAKEKERQGLELRNKMDEMKRRKETNRKQDAEFVEIIELQDK